MIKLKEIKKRRITKLVNIMKVNCFKCNIIISNDDLESFIDWINLSMSIYLFRSDNYIKNIIEEKADEEKLMCIRCFQKSNS